MKPAQRLGLVALAAVVLIAAFVLLQPGDDSDGGADRTGAPAATSPATTETTPTSPASTTESPTTQTTEQPARPPSPLLTARAVRSLRVKRGETVRFRVRSSVAEEVHVHGYDLKRDVPAGRTVSMQFRASLEGVFEIELEHSGTEIASLRVDP